MAIAHNLASTSEFYADLLAQLSTFNNPTKVSNLASTVTNAANFGSTSKLSAYPINILAAPIVTIGGTWTVGQWINDFGQISTVTKDAIKDVSRRETYFSGTVIFRTIALTGNANVDLYALEFRCPSDDDYPSCTGLVTDISKIDTDLAPANKPFPYYMGRTGPINFSHISCEEWEGWLTFIGTLFVYDAP